jgi:hypothetical protein
MKLIEKLNPCIETQPTSLGSRPDLMSFNPGETVQVHHNGAGHWLTSSSMGGTVRLYDSLNLTPTRNLLEQMAAIYHPGSDNATMARMTQQVYIANKQRGAKDCGLFAIAYAVDLAQGVEPSNIKYDQARMRRHLLGCFARGAIKRFPRQRAPEGEGPTARPPAAPDPSSK